MTKYIHQNAIQWEHSISDVTPLIRHAYKAVADVGMTARAYSVCRGKRLMKQEMARSWLAIFVRDQEELVRDQEEEDDAAVVRSLAPFGLARSVTGTPKPNCYSSQVP
jgi:hypothetical protein